MLFTTEATTSVGGNYMSYELDSLRLQVMQEVNILQMKEYLLSESTIVYDRTVLMEDAASARQKISIAITKMIDVIKRLSQRFQTIALTMVARNKNWLEAAKKKIDQNTVIENYSYTIFPYWSTLHKLTTFQIPFFQESNPDLVQSLHNEGAFREKYFKDTFIRKHGQLVYDPKGYFRGKVEKIIMDKKGLLTQKSAMLQYIEKYADIVKKIADSNKMITGVLEIAASRAKTAPIREVSYLVETVLTLLEDDAAKPVTSNDVDKASTVKDGEAPKPQENVKDLVTARQNYGKWCYEMNAARMLIAEECYNSYVKALSAAMYHSKKEGREG